MYALFNKVCVFLPTPICRFQNLIHGIILFFLVNPQVLAQEKTTPDAETYYEQALNVSNTTEKVRLLQLALKSSQSFVNARLELAKTYIQKQQYRKALDQLDTSLNYDRKNAFVWYQKGRAHAKLSEYDIGLKCMERAIKLLDNVPEFYINFGDVHYQLESYDDAMVAFEKVLSLAIATENKDQQAEAWYWKGRVHFATGDTSNALHSFKRALKLKPEHKEAGVWLSKVSDYLRLQALYREAQAAFEQEDLQKSKSILLSIFKRDSTFKDVEHKLSQVERALEEETQIVQSEIGALDNQIPEVTSEPKTSEVITEPIDVETNRMSKGKTDSVVKEIASFEGNQKSESTSTKKPVVGIASPQEPPQSELVSSNKSLLKPTTLKWFTGLGALIALFILSVVVMKKKTWQSLKTVLQSKLDDEATKTIVLPRDVLTTELDRYRIEQEIGRGGMGHVYKAYDQKLERPVALKVIRLETAMDKDEIQERIARFRREAKATAKLNHPNIVNLYDYDEKDGTFFMTMEYVEGSSVQVLLDKKKHLKIDQAVQILRECCLALDYAHRQNLIHRDIKPSNIMLNQEGRVKILDFGIAKMLDLTQTQRYTMTGMRLGSPSYMSPEQINAGFLDGRSDIFALGVVFYETLVGEKPFQFKEGDNLGRLFYVILNTEPKRPRSIRKEIPTRIEKVVLRMLAKNSDERFQNAREIINALG